MKIEFIEEVYELPLFAQFEDIPYSNGLKCNCGFGTVVETTSYKLIGYCETKAGFMGIMECRQCFEKYRHHMVGFGNKYDIESLKQEAGLTLHLQYHLNQTR